MGDIVEGSPSTVPSAALSASSEEEAEGGEERRKVAGVGLNNLEEEQARI